MSDDLQVLHCAEQLLERSCHQNIRYGVGHEPGNCRDLGGVCHRSYEFKQLWRILRHHELPDLRLWIDHELFEVLEEEEPVKSYLEDLLALPYI